MCPLAPATAMVPSTGSLPLAVQVIVACPMRVLVTENDADLPAEMLTLPALTSLTLPVRFSVRLPELPLARCPVTFTEPFIAPDRPSADDTLTLVTATPGSPV